MQPRALRIRNKLHRKGAVGLWFRLVYYAELLLICGLLVGTLYLASLAE